ncbi:MAG: BtpA/SgcQ family protein [Candidatus Micrarchaeia archaeon]
MHADRIVLKHGRMPDRKTISKSVKEAISKGSNGIVVTGSITGMPPSIKKCVIARRASAETHLIVGSGLSILNAKQLLGIADGAIVGTSIKDGEYVSYEKAKALADLVYKLFA